jgi:hypothetical protein
MILRFRTVPQMGGCNPHCTPSNVERDPRCRDHAQPVAEKVTSLRTMSSIPGAGYRYAHRREEWYEVPTFIGTL